MCGKVSRGQQRGQRSSSPAFSCNRCLASRQAPVKVSLRKQRDTTRCTRKRSTSPRPRSSRQRPWRTMPRRRWQPLTNLSCLKGKWAQPRSTAKPIIAQECRPAPWPETPSRGEAICQQRHSPASARSWPREGGYLASRSRPEPQPAPRHSLYPTVAPPKRPKPLQKALHPSLPRRHRRHHWLHHSLLTFEVEDLSTPKSPQQPGPLPKAQPHWPLQPPDDPNAAAIHNQNAKS